MNLQGFFDSSVVMVSEMIDHWGIKISIGTMIAAICDVMGIDADLALMCFCTLTGDMIVRILVLAKRDKPLARGLKKAIPRYMFYMIFIVLAWCVQFAISRAISLDIGFVNVTLGYLIVTDAASIVGQLTYLGVPFPAVVRKVVMGSKRKIEKTVDETFEFDDNDDVELAPPTRKNRKVKNDGNETDNEGA